jgi:hypothetical protein
MGDLTMTEIERIKHNHVADIMGYISKTYRPDSRTYAIVREALLKKLSAQELSALMVMCLTSQPEIVSKLEAEGITAKNLGDM